MLFFRRIFRGTQLPGIVFTMHGIRLQVQASDADQALQILNEMAERGHEENEQADADRNPSENAGVDLI